MTARDDLLSLEELARRCECRVRLVERLFQFGVIEEAAAHTPPRFTTDVVVRVERALRLRRDLRVGFGSMGLVLDLLDRVEALERELSRRGG